MSKYLVGHELLEFAWDDAPTLIFAPAGGGKTALRLLTTYSCWIGHGINYPFPLPYILPRSLVSYPAPDLPTLLFPLLQSSARVLLLALAYRPERVLGLNGRDQQRLAAFLERYLPRPLPWYLDILHSDPTPEALRPMLDRTYRLPNPPTSSLLREMTAALTLASRAPALPELPPLAAIDLLLSLLIETMQFRAVHLLLDEADGMEEGQTNPSRIAAWLKPLLSQSASWSDMKFYVKGFLPREAEPALLTLSHDLSTPLHSLRLHWTVPLLAELVQRRVLVASRGSFGTLDAISSPSLRDVETLLAQAVRPFPREILLLVQQVLRHFVHRTKGQEGQLEREDVLAAIAWYNNNPVTALQEAASLPGA